MIKNRKIDGWNFEFVSQDEGESQFYQCRGPVVYDNYYGETPEPSLWRAALELEKKLLSEGFDAEACHSEKGWVEVEILK